MDICTSRIDATTFLFYVIGTLTHQPMNELFGCLFPGDAHQLEVPFLQYHHICHYPVMCWFICSNVIAYCHYYKKNEWEIKKSKT